MSERPLLSIRGLSRRFGELAALDGVNLEVRAGEVVALLGENGAGKSTLVEILAGGLAAHAGTVELDGAPYRPADPRQARAAGVGVVHQHFQLVEAFTVAENLQLATGLAGGRLGPLRQRMERTLGLPLPAPEAVAAGLAVGERQRVELAKALAVEPRLLLLDEPTAVLTPGEAEALIAGLRRLAKEGTGVVFITHRLDEVARVADRVVVLRRGRVVAETSAAAPMETLARAMVGELPKQGVPRVGAPGEVVLEGKGLAVPGRLLPLDLKLRAGEVVAAAGVDGNGQAALAERITGLARGPGMLELAGWRTPGHDPGELRRRGIWLVPGERVREGIVGPMTVAENLALGRHRDRPLARHGWLSPRELRRRVEALIAGFGIAGEPGQRADTLSGGNQQRVVVARALAARPVVLAAVHSTRGLDVAAEAAVEARLLEAAAAGCALLLVTSDLEAARRLAHRILVFSRGRVVGRGGPETPPEVLARWVGGVAA